MTKRLVVCFWERLQMESTNFYQLASQTEKTASLKHSEVCGRNMTKQYLQGAWMLLQSRNHQQRVVSDAKYIWRSSSNTSHVMFVFQWLTLWGFSLQFSAGVSSCRYGQKYHSPPFDELATVQQLFIPSHCLRYYEMKCGCEAAYRWALAFRCSRLMDSWALQ